MSDGMMSRVIVIKFQRCFSDASLATQSGTTPRLFYLDLQSVQDIGLGGDFGLLLSDTSKNNTAYFCDPETS
jgi:hypothetical protein